MITQKNWLMKCEEKNYSGTVKKPYIIKKWISYKQSANLYKKD